MSQPIIIRIDADSASGQAKIEAFTKSLEKQMQQAGKSTSDASKGMDGFGASIDGAVKKLAGMAAAYVSINAIVGVMKDIVTAGAEFERNTVLMKTAMGATAEETERLTTLARNLGATEDTSAASFLNNEKALAKWGYSAKEIEATLGSTTHLAEIFESSITTAGQAVRIAMDEFKVPLEDADLAADKFAVTLQKSMFPSLEALTGALDTVANTASGYNYSLDTTLVSMRLFAEAAHGGEKGAMAFRMMMADLSKQTDQLDASLKKIGLTYDQVNPAMNDVVKISQNLASSTIDLTGAYEIFGPRVGAIIYKVVESIRSGRAEIQGFYDDLADGAGTVERAKAEMEMTLTGVWGRLKSTIEAGFLGIFDNGKDGLKKAVGEIEKAISNILAAIKSEDISNLTWVITKLTEALLGLSKAITFSIGGIRNLVSAVWDSTGFGSDIAGLDKQLERANQSLDFFQRRIQEMAKEGGISIPVAVTPDPASIETTKAVVENAVAVGGQAGTIAWTDKVIAASGVIADSLAKAMLQAAYSGDAETFYLSVKQQIGVAVQQGVVEAFKVAIIDAQIIQPLVTAIQSLKIDLVSGAVTGLEQVRLAASDAATRMEYLWPVVEEVTGQLQSLFPELVSVDSGLRDIADTCDYETGDALDRLGISGDQASQFLQSLGLSAEAASDALRSVRGSGGSSGSSTSSGYGSKPASLTFGSQEELAAYNQYLHSIYSRPFQGGSEFVPRTGPAIVHAGEKIIRKEEASQASHTFSLTMNINALDGADLLKITREKIIPALQLSAQRGWM